MSSNKRKSASVRKAEIVDMAILMAAEIGVDQITTEKLATRIGISQAAIFRHFPKKSEIWHAIARHIKQLLESESKQHLIADAPAQEKIRNLVLGQLDFITRLPAIPAILFSQELHLRNRELRELFLSMMSARKEIFENLINKAIVEGDFRHGLDSNNGAWLILSLIQGMAMRWSLNGGEFDLVREGRHLLEILFAGFLIPQTDATQIPA